MKQFDAVVIGAGPGGYVCAIRLAQLGIKTAIIEREFIGGVCLNVGCIPSKALIYAANSFWRAQHDFPDMGLTATNLKCDLEKVQQWKESVVKKLTQGVSGLLKMNGVESIRGNAIFKDLKTIEVVGAGTKESIQSKAFVIATGSRVFEIPTLPFNGKNIINSTEALALREIPKRMIIVGGGFIGIEIGTVYAKLGSQVTVIEALGQILPTTDPELVAVVEKKLRKLGVTVYTEAKALGVEEKDPAKSKVLHLKVESKEKGSLRIEAECILVSVGRKPNSDGMGLETIGVKLDPKGNIITDKAGATNVAGVYAIGDVNGAPQLAHRASMDGLLVAETISGKKAYRDYKTVPWAIFSDPEIATCGLTESEARAQGFDVRVGKFPFAAAGRALSTMETDGVVKVILDNKSKALLGVHIVGPEASNLIAEAALAIEMGATEEDILRTIHTHPTLPEAFPEAIEAAFFKAIHIYKPAAKRAP